MAFKPAIIMYTISDDATRTELNRQLRLRYNDALEELDQSTFAVPILSAHPSAEVEAFRQICRLMVQNHFVFADEDTFKFCCAATRLNYHPGDYEYDKIAVYDVFQRFRRR